MPVEEEVPVEGVFVVRDGGDEGDHEFAAAAGFGGAFAEVEVLPEDGVVFLVHADGVFDGQRVAVAVGGDAVEVFDFAQAVTAQGQGVGHVADVVFAGVEGVLFGLDGGGVTVRDDHFREGGPVDHGPFDALVAEFQLVQDQAFAGGEADAEGPVGPLDVVAGDGEGRAFGLGDGDRLQVGAGLADVFGQVVPADADGTGMAWSSSTLTTSPEFRSTITMKFSIGWA